VVCRGVPGLAGGLRHGDARSIPHAVRCSLYRIPHAALHTLHGTSCTIHASRIPHIPGFTLHHFVTVCLPRGIRQVACCESYSHVVAYCGTHDEGRCGRLHDSCNAGTGFRSTRLRRSRRHCRSRRRLATLCWATMYTCHAIPVMQQRPLAPKIFDGLLQRYNLHKIAGACECMQHRWMVCCMTHCCCPSQDCAAACRHSLDPSTSFNGVELTPGPCVRCVELAREKSLEQGASVLRAYW
jgi:hypothetical protein